MPMGRYAEPQRASQLEVPGWNGWFSPAYGGGGSIEFGGGGWASNREPVGNREPIGNELTAADELLPGAEQSSASDMPGVPVYSITAAPPSAIATATLPSWLIPVALIIAALALMGSKGK